MIHWKLRLVYLAVVAVAAAGGALAYMDSSYW